MDKVIEVLEKIVNSCFTTSKQRYVIGGIESSKFNFKEALTQAIKDRKAILEAKKEQIEALNRLDGIADKSIEQANDIKWLAEEKKILQKKVAKRDRLLDRERLVKVIEKSIKDCGSYEIFHMVTVIRNEGK